MLYTHIKKCFLFAFVVLLGVTTSCVSDSSKKLDHEAIDKAIEDDYTDLEASVINFKIPTPMEVFSFLEYNGSGYIEEAPSDPDYHKNYVTQKAKALNFGVYSADLAYCCIYEDFQNTITYFNVAKLLASELGLNQGYGNEMATRFNDNLTNIDSLADIAAQSYYEANAFLEDQGLANLLGYILIGGWIETLYLAIETAKEDPLSSPSYERIADQRFLLENILAFVKVNSLETEGSDLFQNLKNLELLFDELNFNDEHTVITKKQFVDIANKTTEIRNIITR